MQLQFTTSGDPEWDGQKRHLQWGEAARNAYREYRRTQHALRLNGASYARVPPAQFAAEIEAVGQLWTQVFEPNRG